MSRAKKKLSFKRIVHIGFTGLNHPVRIAVTALLTVIAFLAAGIAVSFAMCDEEQARVQTYAQFVDSFVVQSMEGSCSLTEAETLAQELGLRYGGVGTFESFADAFIASFGENYTVEQSFEASRLVNDYRQNNPVHIPYSIRRIAWFPDGLYETQGIPFLSGGLPRKSGEIAVCSCYANYFTVCGLQDSEPLSSAKDLTGKSIPVALPEGEGTATALVSGVYDCSSCAWDGQIDITGTDCYPDDATEWRGAALLSQEDFTAYAEQNGADCLIFSGDHDKKTGKKVSALFGVFDEDGEGKYYSEVFFDLVKATEKLSSVRNAFALAAPGLCVFSLLLTYQLLSVFIDDKKQTIGILRALGARGGDCAKIALVEGLAFGLASGLIAAILTVALTPLANVYLSFALNGTVALVAVQPLAAVIVAVMGVIGGLLSSVIPVVRLVRMSPLDAIVLCGE